MVVRLQEAQGERFMINASVCFSLLRLSAAPCQNIAETCQTVMQHRAQQLGPKIRGNLRIQRVPSPILLQGSPAALGYWLRRRR